MLVILLVITYISTKLASRQPEPHSAAAFTSYTSHQYTLSCQQQMQGQLHHFPESLSPFFYGGGSRSHLSMLLACLTALLSDNTIKGAIKLRITLLLSKISHVLLALG